MRDRSHTESATATRGNRFHRRFRGYAVHVVDDALEELETRVHDLEGQAVELREELLETQHTASETKHDLTRARAELRYWNDRASYVDSEVSRARQRATEMEATARARAEAIEADAQERSLQLIDRVCEEANTMLHAARAEAREMFLRFETDVDMSQQKLERLESVRREVSRTMQGALNQFEEAVRELDKVSPARRIVESLEPPVRRAVPTFGQQKALDAAQRFETTTSDTASAAMSTPLKPTSRSIAAALSPADDADEPSSDDAHDLAPDHSLIHAPLQMTDPILVVDPSAGDEQAVEETRSPARRTHDADEEFASLLLQQP
jgi:vacuolar-type H+-ATPase subunit H